MAPGRTRLDAPLEATVLRLNLGSGPARVDGWLSVDVFWANAPEVVADGMTLPFVKGGFNIAYVGHVLEYVHPEFCVDLMAEVRRVLRPGGHLAVVTPDLRKLMTLVRRDRVEPEAFHEAVYGEDLTGFDRQLWLPDVASIISILRAAGFGDVEAHSRSLGRGWPSYEPRPWEAAVRAVNPLGPVIGNDGGREGQDEEDPMLDVKNEALTEAVDAGLTVRHRIEAGKYVATVIDGDKIGVGRGDTLEEAIGEARGSTAKVEEGATSTDIEAAAATEDDETTSRRRRSNA